MLGVQGYPTSRPQNELTKMLDPHPMERKMELAELIVSDFHGKDAGRKAAEHFQRVFRDRQAPEESIEIYVQWDSKVGGVWREDLKNGDIRDLGPWLPFDVATTGIEKWSKLLTQTKRVPSASEAERLMKQGAVEIDGDLLKDPTAKINLTEKSKFSS